MQDNRKKNYYDNRETIFEYKQIGYKQLYYYKD